MRDINKLKATLSYAFLAMIIGVTVFTINYTRLKSSSEKTRIERQTEYDQTLALFVKK